MKLKICLTILPLFLAMQVSALTTTLITDDLEAPWGLSFVNEHELLVSERTGGLKVVHVKSGKITNISGAPAVSSKGQGGLLDVAVDRGWIYLTYSKQRHERRSATVLARTRLNLQQQALQDWQVLLTTESDSATAHHFGSRMVFANGYLFFSVGDRGHRPNGQDLGSHAGSILRLNPDGSVPSDNPFVGVKGALPEIWSYGHRNPQGLAYDEANQRLWAIEHGPRGGDEINLIVKGQNYGWPLVSLGKEYTSPLKVGKYRSHPDYFDPVKAYIPSIAPSSLLYYNGDFLPELKSKLIAGALKLSHLNVVSLDGGKAVDEQRFFEQMQRRIRALAVDSEGALYFATDRGELWRVDP